MWLINRASHEVSRDTNSDAINRNQRSGKDRLGKIAILMQRYSVHYILIRILYSIYTHANTLINRHKIFRGQFFVKSQLYWFE